MATNDSTTPLKVCTKCKEPFPATPEYFARSNSTKDGLHTWCKKCKNAQNRDWWHENVDTINAKRREDYPKHRERNVEYHREWRLKNHEKILVQKRADYWANPEANNEKSRAWREAHPEQKKEYDKTYFQKNKPRIRVYKKKWADKNRDYINEYRRNQYAEDPHGIRLAAIKREARKRNLPDDFTAEDWNLCLEYFSGCAVCGAREVLHADHWIPLANVECLGTVPHNMVSLCRSCNFSKQDTPAQEWLEWKHGTEIGSLIYKRICHFLNNIVRKVD